MPTEQDPREELRPLLDLAARVGRNPLLTQASTGNISMKLGDLLWIKASGKWLADAANDNILIPLDLPGFARPHGGIWIRQSIIPTPPSRPPCT